MTTAVLFWWVQPSLRIHWGYSKPQLIPSTPIQLNCASCVSLSWIKVICPRVLRNGPSNGAHFLWMICVIPAFCLPGQECWLGAQHRAWWHDFITGGNSVWHKEVKREKMEERREEEKKRIDSLEKRVTYSESSSPTSLRQIFPPAAQVTIG